MVILESIHLVRGSLMHLSFTCLVIVCLRQDAKTLVGALHMQEHQEGAKLLNKQYDGPPIVIHS